MPPQDRSNLSTGSGPSRALLTGLLLAWGSCFIQAQNNPPPPPPARTNVAVLSLDGPVEVLKAGSIRWVEGSTNAPYNILQSGDQLRTLENGRAVVRLADFTLQRLGPDSHMRVLEEPQKTTFLELLRGLFHFSHRDRPGDVKLKTPTVSMGTRGTEFSVTVTAADGTTVVNLFDGKVLMSNPFGQLLLEKGHQGMAEPAQAPRRTSVVVADGSGELIQWFLYYPGILDLQEMSFTAAEQSRLQDSIQAYGSGDILEALQALPPEAGVVSPMETLFRAGLILGAGRVNEAELHLNELRQTTQPWQQTDRLARALQMLIQSVKLQGDIGEADPAPFNRLASEWLAASYDHQSRSHSPDALANARTSAREATVKSPRFGFAWVRLAELEFSHGQDKAANHALQQGLALSPRNPQALSLQGFLLAGQNRFREAITYFSRALAIDGGLGNAWLGRGLCRIRLGQKAAGLQDLEIAAAVEPQRALFRNYLGKAFGIMNDEERARLELDRGRSLDPKDPTSWLYSAILNQQQSRINRAVRELEVSRDLNQNRQVYRSQFLLDQDEAVRRANLASIYRDAGMFDVSVTEAALGVQADYANSSAHLFLADSFNTLRDSTRVNLRYDTVWINELLLANILAPVGAGRLSQNISQNEYSSLFSSTDPSLFSLTDYRSDGEVKELASFYGTYGNTGYAFDLDYQHNDGVRPNNDLSRVEWFTTIKHQITPSDSILVFTKYEDFEAGDIFQYYDPRRASPTFEYEEHQEPVALAAYHHQWRPGVHTLVLGGLLNSEQKASEPSGAPLSLVERPLGVVDNAARYPLEVEYKSQFDIYTSELQQIFQNDRQTFVAGVRYQAGDFDTRSLLTNPRPELAFLYTIPPADTRATEDFERMSFYGYYTLKLLDTLSLTGGIVHDRVTYPKNLRSPPIAPGHETDNQLSPKSALVWTPHPHLSVRGIYTRSLGGVSLDETYRLEPTQLAGFAQTFRTIIPESVVGSVETPSYQTAGVALDYWIKKTDTYLKLQVENLSSEVDRAVGNMRLDFVQNLFYPSITPQKLDYKETSLVLTANQLLSESWALGCQYKFIHAKLRHAYPELPLARDPWVRATERADLHRVTLFGLFNHPSGLFARADAQFYQQHNTGYSPDKPGDAFWQYNLWVGYRLFHRRAELALGILNLTDQNYRLNPLSAYTELPRERVFSARLKWKL